MEKDTNFRNELFKRNEMQFLVNAVQTPSLEEAKKLVAEKTNKHIEVIDLHSVKGIFGSNQFKISAYVYDTKEHHNKTFQKSKKQIEAEKKAIEEAKKAEDEAKKAEAGNTETSE